jgi:hypothetical protein
MRTGAFSSTELVLSPRWAITVGDIDGTPHVVLRIYHPRLGPLDFLLPKNEPIELAAALEKTWERRDEGRIGTATQTGDDIETVRPHRQAGSSWWSRFIRWEPVVTSKFIATDVTAAKDKRSKGSD